jgi:hypothetical protein
MLAASQASVFLLLSPVTNALSRLDYERGAPSLPSTLCKEAQGGEIRVCIDHLDLLRTAAEQVAKFQSNLAQ